MDKSFKPVLFFCLWLFALTGQAIADPVAEMEAELAYVAGNFAKAVELYTPLAEQGSVVAQQRLGSIYSAGSGVLQDDKEAAKWYRLASEQGDATAQVELGSMYYFGRGVPQDDKEALQWYRRAAEQGNSLAQTNLGVMYLNGRGADPDEKEAVKWCRLAAAQGYAPAQEKLGAAYASGLGVPQDYIQSYMWLDIAISSSADIEFQQKTSGQRASIAKLMTANQIAEAQKLSRKCTKNNFKEC